MLRNKALKHIPKWKFWNFQFTLFQVIPSSNGNDVNYASSS